MSNEASRLFYKIKEAPCRLWAEFDAAVAGLAGDARNRGYGGLSQAAALSALLRGVDLSDSIIIGQALAHRYEGEERADRGFQLPADLKALLITIADQKGVKVGALGRLVMIARAGRLRASIEAGLGGAGEVPAP